MTELLHDRYRLDEVIGQGAMGVVWRAHDEVLDRPIAIKELRPAPGVDPTEALDRFLVEARAAARLSHPNIVCVHDVFSDGERVLIVMELIQGPTLDLVIADSGAQPAELVRAVMAQVAQALAAAHEAGVIHRDLKPENIFWAKDRAVVADFGLARIGAGRGTVEGTVMGTPGYMAPEQVKGTATGPAADVFGWGAVAYHLASGAAPFGEPSLTDPSALAYRIVHQDPASLVLPRDAALAELIRSALSKDPAGRPADGVALVGRLTEATGRMKSGGAEVVRSPVADEVVDSTTTRLDAAWHLKLLTFQHLRSGVRYRLRSLIEAVPTILHHNEELHLVTDARHIDVLGLLVITNERVLFSPQGGGPTSVDTEFRHIRNVVAYHDQAFRNLRGRWTIAIHTTHSRIAFRCIGNQRWANEVVATIRQIGEATIDDSPGYWLAIFEEDSEANFVCSVCLSAYRSLPLTVTCLDCGGSLVARSGSPP